MEIAINIHDNIFFLIACNNLWDLCFQIARVALKGAPELGRSHSGPSPAAPALVQSDMEH